MQNVNQPTESEMQHAARLAQYLPIFASRAHLLPFTRLMQPDFDLQAYHEVYYTILDMFAHGHIKKLIITMPPRHGKSQGSSRMLPSFMLGLNPWQKIAIGSYAASLAQDFCRDTQRIIEQPEYQHVFPRTVMPRVNNKTVSGAWLRNANVVEMVGCAGGGLRVVGRGGSLSGKDVDIMIMDDIYKDAAEGNSPVIRDAAFKWYTSVVRKRMPKQQLIVFTRWHEDDLIGRIEENEDVVTASTWEDVRNVPKGAWLKINFEAIKTGEPTELDPRQAGLALWENRYPLKQLEAERKIDPIVFECLNQGNPGSAAGRLYREFNTYQHVEDVGTVVGKGSYTDTADTGDDYLCSICYDKVRLSVEPGIDPRAIRYALCVTDVLYTQEPMEITEAQTAAMYDRTNTRYAMVESNNGGRGFARAVARFAPRTNVGWFAQTKNKESRILTNAPMVQQHIYMPVDWAVRWPKFYEHITKYLRNYVGNQWHDAPDALTGCVELDIDGNGMGGGVTRRN